jgi:hypothetical protein
MEFGPNDLLILTRRTLLELERKKDIYRTLPGKICMCTNGEMDGLTPHERVFSLALADSSKTILFLLWCYGGMGCPMTQRKIFGLSFESRAKEEIRVHCV